MNPDGDENQNNLDGVPNTNTTQQGIFTPEPTPQPTVNQTQDQPVLTGTIVEPAQTGLSHPYLSNHPTQSFASNAGDIILEKNKPKKQKTKIIILMAVLAVIILCVVIGVIIVASSNVTLDNTIKGKFNRFANTLLYNDDSPKSLDASYQYGRLYYLANLDNKDSIQVYFTKAESKYQDFLSTYKTYAEENPEDEIAQLNLIIFQEYYEKLDLLHYITLRPNVSPTEFTNAFLENSGLVSGLINEYYNMFSESSVESTRSYAGAYKSKLESLLVAFNIYDSRGCLQDRGTLIACQRDSSEPQLVTPNEIYDNFRDFYLEQTAVYRELKIDVFRDVWFMNEELNNL